MRELNFTETQFVSGALIDYPVLDISLMAFGGSYIGAYVGTLPVFMTAASTPGSPVVYTPNSLVFVSSIYLGIGLGYLASLFADEMINRYRSQSKPVTK
ncbi:MAG: hypothetical protein ACHQJ6_06460 [Candidatus Berkiellales bacterium]